VQVNIVGFDVDINAARQLRHAARSGGGKYFQAPDAGDLDRIFRDNYNWAKWTAYYNCKFTKEYRRFNEVFRNAYEAYNCVHRSAYGEYNAIHRDAYGEYNAMLDEILGDDRYQKVRDTVVALAEDRRDQIIESAQRVRDHVVSRAQDRRDRLITATQTRRESVIVSAATHWMQHSSGPPSCVTKASATNDGPWEL
jgi:Ca-activated chloride channel homolog